MSTFGNPIATSAPVFPTVAHPLSPATLFAYSASKIKPTNVWWQNFLVGTGGQTVSTVPYIQKALPKGLHITHPLRTSNTTSELLNPSVKNITLEVNETITTREILDYDDMSVSTRWNISGGSMLVDLVRGQAFNSAKYTAATPLINTIHAITQVNGTAPGAITGTKFKVVMNNGQTWMVYASTSLTLTWSSSGAVATAPFTGYLQIAILLSSPQEAVYDASGSSARATTGHVTAVFAGDTATMTYAWGSEGDAPLIYAQPHHQDTLSSVTYTALEMRGMKGVGKAIKASTWTVVEPLTTIGWEAPGIIEPTALPDIIAAVNAEKDYIADTENDGNGVDPYFTGKWVTKMARIMLIADQVGESAVVSTVAANLKPIILDWFSGALENDLKYETTWGGVVSSNGIANPGADFGGGYYNDHHFHWGYWIYAAAAVAKDDPTFLAAVEPYINDLLRDLMNPSLTDTYFPRFRYKDFYDGHSSAAGLFEFGDARNQESTSEAANAWYAAMLWGQATADADITDVARLHLALEIRATHKYWHISDTNPIYDAPFNTNPSVGILWSTKVDAVTFFGAEKYKVVGIQALPFSPITEELVTPEFAQRSMDAITSLLPSATGWDSVSYGIQAVVDPNVAYNNLLTSVRDDGASKSNDLWWAATRGTEITPPVDPPDPAPAGGNQLYTFVSKRL